MTNDEINRAVAMELGWTDVKLLPQPYWGPYHRGIAPGDSESSRKQVPDFCTDHNAAAEMRKSIKTETERSDFGDEIDNATGGYLRFDLINSTPRQQAEAFLQMRGKWVEEKV